MRAVAEVLDQHRIGVRGARELAGTIGDELLIKRLRLRERRDRAPTRSTLAAIAGQAATLASNFHSVDDGALKERRSGAARLKVGAVADLEQRLGFLLRHAAELRRLLEELQLERRRGDLLHV